SASWVLLQVLIPGHRPSAERYCRAAANAEVASERITAARSRGRSPWRRGTSPPAGDGVWRSAAATAGWAASDGEGKRQDRRPVTLDPAPVHKRRALHDRLVLFGVFALQVAGILDFEPQDR